jgi:catechol 2,3-dioxygenase-like lactoylglutathione lyase family enzyme
MTDRHVVVDHVLFIVADLEASRRLYTAALAPLGIEELKVDSDGVNYGRQGIYDFVIYQGEPVTTAAHVAFDSADRAAVDELFHSPAPIGDAPIRSSVP